MRHLYELTVIVRLEVNEEATQAAVNQVKAWIEAENLGQINKTDTWGRRKLAYEIDKQREGFYIHMQTEIDPQGLPELERNLKLSPSVLRYLLLRAGQ